MGNHSPSVSLYRNYIGLFGITEMNERIKELIKQMDQAGLPYGDNAMTVTDRDLEYFAELIVRECIDKIETYRIPVGNSSAGEMACEWTYDALKEIRDDIKETFGIKE
jgi:pyrrolidone-carboxylate peptidase